MPTYFISNFNHDYYCGWVFALQPPYGTPIKGKDVVICKFPSDPTVALGSLSVVTLFVAAVIGHIAVYYPYKGKTVPNQALFCSTTLVVFFMVAE